MGLHKGKKSHPADGIAAFLSSGRSNLAHSAQVSQKNAQLSGEL